MSPMKIPNFLIDRDIIPGYNHIINGNFDVWQRAWSQTATGYRSDDMWNNGNIGTTKVHSNQAFALGEVFPDGEPCPKYFSRTVVSSVTGAGNYCLKYQAIENLQNLAGKQFLLSFRAKADAPKFMSIEVIKRFGSGGTPSGTENAVVVKKIQLTTQWKRYQVLIDVPSILGKILGTNNNDGLLIVFWFDGGTNFDVRTDSLGHQSGTFDIATVALTKGKSSSPIATRPIRDELALCKRYYEEFDIYFLKASATTNWGGFRIIRKFDVAKRDTPIITLYRDGTKTNTTQIDTNLGLVAMSALSTPGADKQAVYFHNANTILTQVGDYGAVVVTADASL